MWNKVTVYRSRIVVSEGGKNKPREYLLHGRNQLPLVLAVLHTEQQQSRNGVADRDLWRSKFFAHFKSIETVRKTVQRHKCKLRKLCLGGSLHLLQIEHGAGASSGNYRLVVAPDTSLVLGEDLKALLEENASTVRAPWQLLPIHDRSQLLAFATAITEAAYIADSGEPQQASQLLVNALSSLTAPEYCAVILMQLARTSLRVGNETDAEAHLLQAIELVMRSREIDLVLLAQARYNRAWIAYTKGDFGLQAIRDSRKALAAAVPDDLCHGHVASLHGLLVIKEIERNHRDFSKPGLTFKCHEAVAYLTHAVYLLVRAEDFWGAQEACWNLAYGLFQIGNLKTPVPSPSGLLGRSTLEIKGFLDLSDRIGIDHGTGGFSLRNSVLLASVHMTRDQNLQEAEKVLAEAGKTSNLKRRTSPREMGRLHERRLHLCLERLSDKSGDRSELHKSAREAYKKAKEHWSSPGLESLLENELLARYELRGDQVRRL